MTERNPVTHVVDDDESVRTGVVGLSQRPNTAYAPTAFRYNRPLRLMSM
jgi:FixJ family two-component response regulator